MSGRASCAPISRSWWTTAEAMFASMMESMTGGWGGSFDKLDEYLAG